MRDLLLKILNWKLALIARLLLKRFKPEIIGITGSVGKTSTKLAIYTVLKEFGYGVRAAGGNLNNETGLPLAIIGDYQKSTGFLFLSKAILAGFVKLISPFSGRNYPKILILEYGADKPGDIDYLVKIAKPNIAVVTAIGETPVHIEFYEGQKEVIKEKEKLVKAVGQNGFVILNADDPDVISMRAGERTKTYGFSKEADIRISNLKNVVEKDRGYLSFDIKSAKADGTVRLEGILGAGYAYAIGAAVAVGAVKGKLFNELTNCANKYVGEKGRMKILRGINDTLIIDDTYNASPESTRNALGVLGGISKRRRIAILGDMLELGSYSDQAHKSIGELAAKTANLLFTVGPQAKLIAKGALSAGMDQANVYSFDTSNEVGTKIRDLVGEGDVVLVKGSQGIRAERVVKDIMASPEMAKDKLVRQYGKWLIN